jgi:hypothetical protein
MRVSRSVDDAFGKSAELRQTACTAARVNETPGDHDLRYASEALLGIEARYGMRTADFVAAPAVAITLTAREGALGFERLFRTSS